MARRKTLLQLLDELGPSVRKAFNAALSEIRSDVQFAALESAIRAGNITAAMDVINVNGAYFRQLDEALRAAHIAGGVWATGEFKAMAKRQGARVSGQFDTRNIRAESLLRSVSSEKVVQIVEGTRVAIRETLETALRAGTSARATATLLVGNVGPTGVRVGGIVGLDSTKAAWVSGGYRADGTFIKGMKGDLEMLDKNYFTRKLRDKRFDGMVRRSFAEGKPLNQTQIAKITDRYTGRLQKLRGEAISRTELLKSLHAAQDEGLQQIIDNGEVAADAIEEEWDASEDKATRPTHAAADGQKVIHGQPFTVGGFLMMYPGDESLGAPAREIIQCRCVKRIDINFMKGLKDRLTPEELAAARSAM